MKKTLNLIIAAAVVVLLAAVAKLALEAFSPCMHKYFEVDKEN